MHTVTVLEGRGASATTGAKPFMVEVDGKLLRDTRGIGRRFKDSFAAGLAGAREVDRLRASDPTGDKHET